MLMVIATKWILHVPISTRLHTRSARCSRLRTNCNELSSRTGMPVKVANPIMRRIFAMGMTDVQVRLPRHLHDKKSRFGMYPIES